MIVSWPSRACGADPRARLQHVRDHVAMSEHRALGDAGRAAGVLQERDVVVRDRRPASNGRNWPCSSTSLKRTAPGSSQCGTCLRTWRTTRFTIADFGQPSWSPTPVTMTCSSCGALDHLGERVREVLEDHDRFRAGIGQLMLELARGVERIRVDDGQPGAQRAVQRDRVLQDVRQHDRDPVALLQFRDSAAARPRSRARSALVLGVGDRAAQAGEGGRSAKRSQLSLEQLVSEGYSFGIDLRRHAGRIVLQPDLVHRFPDVPVIFSAAVRAGHSCPAIAAAPAAVGWMPSACISFSSSATPSRKNPTSGASISAAPARHRAHESRRHSRRRSSAACACRPARPCAPAACDLLDHGTRNSSRTCLQRQAAQTVVAAELQDDDRRLVQLQRARQASPCAAGRVAADAGIHHAVSVTLRGEPLLQQRHPGCIDGDAIASAQAVADDQDDRLCGAARMSREPTAAAPVLSKLSTTTFASHAANERTKNAT